MSSKVQTHQIKFKRLNLMTDGSLSGGVNREGIMYYNNLIGELLLKGIPPFFTSIK